MEWLKFGQYAFLGIIFASHKFKVSCARSSIIYDFNYLCLIDSIQCRITSLFRTSFQNAQRMECVLIDYSTAGYNSSYSDFELFQD